LAAIIAGAKAFVRRKNLDEFFARDPIFGYAPAVQFGCIGSDTSMVSEDVSNKAVGSSRSSSRFDGRRVQRR
jgi:hypothetical protein